MSRGWHDFKPYVPVARRRANAEKKIRALQKKGLTAQPVRIEGRAITRTFWGKAWCVHIEGMGDFSNRLPRGRTYVRNNSVCHLEIEREAIRAMVMGSELYRVEIKVKHLARPTWKDVRNKCAGQIGSLLELLQGRLSQSVMKVVCDPREGLFPLRGEIAFSCSCPDWAVMCKHVAAVLYGVGARFDEQPELLFLLRGVNHLDLISADAASVAVLTGGEREAGRIAEDDLGAIFGIEIAEVNDGGNPEPVTSRPAPARKKAATKRDQTDTVAARQGRRRAKAGGETKPPAARKAIAPITRPADPVRARKTVRPKTAWVPAGRNLAALRARLDLTQSEMGRLIGTSQPMISLWERRGGTLRGLHTDYLDAMASLAAKSPTQVRNALKKLRGHP